MGYIATYLNASQFEVYHLEGAVRAGDVLDQLRIGTVLLCSQGTDGDVMEHVEVAIYDAGNDVTRITVRYNRLTANLAEIFRGPLFVDDAAHQSNLSEHDHSAEWQGGNKPFGLFTNANIVARLISLGDIAPAVANFLFGINATGTGVEHKEIIGTDKQILITHGIGSITASLPQDIDTDSSPEFEDLTLSSLGGLLVGNTGYPITALVPSAANQIPRWNVAGNAWEMDDFTLANMKNVELSSPSDGQSLVYSAGKWINALISGSGSSGISRAEAISLINTLSGESESSDAEPHALEHITGGGDVIDGDKLDIDYSPSAYAPVTTPVSDAANQLASHLAGLAAELTVPDPRFYCPEPFYASSDTEITIGAGTYYLEGYRSKRRYEKRNTRSRTFSADTAYAIASYTDGGVVNSSWYSVFLRGNLVRFMPFIRVKSAALDGGNTKIEIGQQDDHTTAEDGFLTANDEFNSLRLLKWSHDSLNGTIFTISDSVNQTGDYLIISGDHTAEISAGDWLQLIPYPETDFNSAYLYLGFFRVGATGNVVECNRKPGMWLYEYIDEDEDNFVNGNLDGTNPANTLVSPIIPPVAVDCRIGVNVSSGTSSVGGIGVNFYRGNAGAYVFQQPNVITGTADEKSMEMDLSWPMSFPCVIRNNFWQDSAAADGGLIVIYEILE